MSSTEGSQRYIGESVLRAIDVRHTEPDDFFRVRINSNDSYSRSIHPTNNCHDFIIEFPQGSSDSMKHRIAQCNRYQVISLRMPIRGNKGIQNSCYVQVPFHSHVLKEVSSFPTSSNGVYNTKFGKMRRPQYVDTYEPLEKLHLVIDCALLNEQMDDQI